MSSCGRILIYGGTGALGKTCVSYFKANNYCVGSVGFAENTDAHYNILLDSNEDLVQQETSVICAVGEILNGEKLDGIFCVAGGWTGGNAKEDLAKSSEINWKQSVCSSLLASSIASRYLKEGGVLQLTGAQTALKPTPKMIAYGVAKSAVHNLTKSLAHKNSGLPANCTAVAILPLVLDTPYIRNCMPNADPSSWTPLEFVAQLFLKWIEGEEKPCSGSLLKLVTKNCKTSVVPV